MIIESSSSILQNTAEAMWSVKLTDSLAGYHDLRSLQAMLTLEATFAGFPNILKYANQPMNLN